MRNDPTVLGKLPVHPDKRREAKIYVLQVDGLVGQTLALTPSDFERLPEQDVTENFACAEGWIVPAVKWGGVTLESVLALAEAHPEAQWVQASAGEFTVPIPLHEARGALLATRLGEETLPVRARRSGSVGCTWWRLLDEHKMAGSPGVAQQARTQHRKNDRAWPTAALHIGS